MATLTETWPEWWNTDPEHGPAVYAFTFLHKQHYIVDRGEDGWCIDFELAWGTPLSSGERILVALAWCLYNLGWAADQEAKARAAERFGPLYMSNPSRAIGTLGGAHWQAYLRMVEIARGRTA